MSTRFAGVLSCSLVIAGALASLLSITQVPPVAAAEPIDASGIRAATARFHDVAAAEAAGYALLADAAGITCIADPEAGAMGVHYANGELVTAGAVDALAPQVLVYEPGADAALHLVGVEYVVFQEGWDKEHDAPPVLFGEEFMLTPAENRYGLPAFYSLHAWVWGFNPDGEFAMWNRQVSCP